MMPTRIEHGEWILEDDGDGEIVLTRIAMPADPEIELPGRKARSLAFSDEALRELEGVVRAHRKLTEP